MSFSVVMVGAGNVAVHLTKRLFETGFNVIQVYSRTEKSASWLAEKYGIGWTNRIVEIDQNADLYIISLKDDAVQPFLAQSALFGKTLVHCSGSLPIEVLTAYSQKAGVLYPLQTFSKSRDIDFNEVPIFVEGSSPETEEFLYGIGKKLSGEVHFANSQQRMILHISAIFSCNFVNHMFTIAAKLLEQHELSFDYLRPLMKETVEKALNMDPFYAQTGPAVRFDKGIIQKHQKALESEPDLLKIYTQLSEHIYTLHKN